MIKDTQLPIMIVSIGVFCKATVDSLTITEVIFIKKAVHKGLLF